MIYLFSMKKVKIKYESHIFQEDYVDRFKEKLVGDLIENDKEIVLSFIINQEDSKELVTLIYSDDKVEIKRSNYTLLFKENQMIECDHNTEYGVIKLITKLKKRLRLDNQIVINYELFIGNGSIGSYIIKVSYEEV